MSVRRAAAALAAAAFMFAITPSRASGEGTWPWPLGSEVSLSYGAAYSGAGGKTCTHGGVDIPAGAEATVRSCAGGRVIFAGPVPSGEGARAIAVTVLTADGLKVTFLPLEQAAVKAGEDVASGQVVGTLASAGDPSTSQIHLHLSVRRGECRIDPAALLAAPTASEPVDVGTRGAGGDPPAPDYPAPAAARVPALATSVAQGAAGSVGSNVPVTNGADRPQGAAPAAALRGAGMSAMLAALRSGSRAMAGAPRVAALSRPEVPPLVRLGDTLSAVARARSGAAWWIVRLMIAAAAIGCVRPLLRSARSAKVPAGQRARA